MKTRVRQLTNGKWVAEVFRSYSYDKEEKWRPIGTDHRGYYITYRHYEEVWVYFRWPANRLQKGYLAANGL